MMKTSLSRQTEFLANLMGLVGSIFSKWIY